MGSSGCDQWPGARGKCASAEQMAYNKAPRTVTKAKTYLQTTPAAWPYVKWYICHPTVQQSYNLMKADLSERYTATHSSNDVASVNCISVLTITSVKVVVSSAELSSY